MDFEPNADESGSCRDLDMRQNSMLLSVTKELPALQLEGVRKRDIDQKVKVFPKNKWLKPFPAYNEGLSLAPKAAKRKGPETVEGVTPRQPFLQLPGDGTVIIAELIMPVLWFLLTFVTF